MTHNASQFIGPLTLEALSRRHVMLDALELLADRRIGHIVAADTADAILVAPATARWMAAMANGLVRRRHHRHVPGIDRPGDRGAGHGWRHVCASGDPRERPDAGRIRLSHRGAWRGSTRLGRHRAGATRGAAEPGRRRGRGHRRSSRAGHRPLPPATGRRAGACPGPRRVARRGHRGWHGGAHRPGAVHRQSLHGPDGCRHRRSGPREGRDRDAHPRHDVGAAPRGRDTRRRTHHHADAAGGPGRDPLRGCAGDGCRGGRLPARGQRPRPSWPEERV